MQGLILINKPSGITSFKAVSVIKRLANEKRVGHTGTLDPMATGVLPVLLGRATSLAGLMLDADKRYIATFKFGITTDTCDITGNVLSESACIPGEQAVLNAIKNMVGEQMQTPPAYSALKQNGVPLYKLARKGITPEVPARKINVYKAQPVTSLQNGEITLDILCSKGTYIRSLCRDLGEQLGSGATLKALHRESTCGFSTADTVDLNTLTPNNIKDYLLNEELAVKHYKEIAVTNKQAFRFANGGALDLNRLNNPVLNNDEIVRVKYNGLLVALGKADLTENQIKMKCLINGCDKIV